MIGAVIATHGELGKELVKVAEFIMGPVQNVEAVSLDPAQDVQVLRLEIQKALKKVDRGQGAIILTDMFGGTPSNISLSFLEENKVDVVTGVNLPMLIKLINCRDKMKLGELAQQVKLYGCKGISQASEILKK